MAPISVLWECSWLGKKVDGGERGSIQHVS